MMIQVLLLALGIWSLAITLTYLKRLAFDMDYASVRWDYVTLHACMGGASALVTIVFFTAAGTFPTVEPTLLNICVMGASQCFLTVTHIKGHKFKVANYMMRHPEKHRRRSSD